MKYPITLLYRNPLERERLLARFSGLGSLAITPLRLRDDLEGGIGACMCWCPDLPSALAAKDTICYPLLLVYPGHSEPLFSLLDGPRCITCTLGEGDASLLKKVERLAKADDGSLGAAESGTYLTEREADVVRLLVSGLDTAQIAVQLGIKAATVAAHKKHIFLKSGVRTTAQLVAWALIRSRPDGGRGGRG